MFIAIATEDFDTFTDNNEAEEWTDYTDKTEYPIFTGMTIAEIRDRVENYFRNAYDAKDDIPAYEICEITTAAIVKGVFRLATECSRINN